MWPWRSRATWNHGLPHGWRLLNELPASPQMGRRGAVRYDVPKQSSQNRYLKFRYQVGYKNYLECPVARVTAAEISTKIEVCNSDRVKGLRYTPALWNKNIVPSSWEKNTPAQNSLKHVVIWKANSGHLQTTDPDTNDAMIALDPAVTSVTSKKQNEFPSSCLWVQENLWINRLVFDKGRSVLEENVCRDTSFASSNNG